MIQNPDQSHNLMHWLIFQGLGPFYKLIWLKFVNNLIVEIFCAQTDRQADGDDHISLQFLG